MSMRAPLTRPVVLEAARTILVHEGLEAVSLRRVASELGVTAPALYAYVRDKRDLMEGIADLELEQLVRQFESVEGQDSVDRLRAMASAYVAFARGNPGVFRAIFLAHPDGGMIGDDGDAPIARIFRIGAGPLRELNERGQLGDVDERTAALSFWTAVHGAATVSVSAANLDPVERERVADTVIDTVLYGLQSLPNGGGNGKGARLDTAAPHGDLSDRRQQGGDSEREGADHEGAGGDLGGRAGGWSNSLL